MAQGNTVLPTTGTITGLQEQEAINAALDALVTNSIGGAAPANASGGAPAQGQFWCDTSTSGVLTLRQYDGASWVPILSINTSAHTVAIPNASLANSQITINGSAVALGGTIALAASSLTNGVTGSGAIVLANSPALTGAPTTPTPSAGDNSQQITNTAWVRGLIAGGTGAAPTSQTLSGSGNYSPPNGCTRIEILMTGAGAGGGGNGTNATAGSDGGDTTFGSSLYSVKGGKGGSPNNAGNGGLGGAGSGTGSGSAIWRAPGAAGESGTNTVSTVCPGPRGAASWWGDGGAWQASPNAVSKGAGGCGAINPDTANIAAGGAGGAAETGLFQIASPTGPYPYSVGAAGAAGTGSYSGGAGANGTIVVREFYN